MAAVHMFEGQGPTKQQSYRLSLERHSVLSGDNALPLSVPPGGLTLEESRHLLHCIATKLPMQASLLGRIQAEYDHRIESQLSTTGRTTTAGSESSQLTEYATLQVYAKEIKDLESDIVQVATENSKLKDQISEQEDVCDRLALFVIESTSQLDSNAGEEKDKYIATVHDLQAKIAHLKHSTESLKHDSSEMALIAECRPLEQCLKEAEVRNLRAKKKNQELRSLIEDLQRQVAQVLQDSTSTNPVEIQQL